MLASLPHEERKVMLLQEWLQAYGDDATGAASYQSQLLRVEHKLQRAVVFSSAVAPPSDISTAVAFEALQMAEQSSGPLRPLLGLVRQTLMQSVYVECASEGEARREMTPHTPALAEGDTHVSMQRFLCNTLHAAEAVRMREERERVRAVAERLRATLVAWERARQEQLMKAELKKKAAGTWQRLLSKTTASHTANARAQLSASLEAGSKDGMMASGYGTVDGAVDAFLAIEGDDVRLRAIMTALETMPHAIRDVVRRLIVGTDMHDASLGAAPAAQLALEALTGRGEALDEEVLTRFVGSLFGSERVVEDPEMASAMLIKAIEAAGTAGLDALPSLLRLVMHSEGGGWRGPAVRFLASVDDDLLRPHQVDSHVQGEEVELARVLRPGELGATFGKMFSEEEMMTLLRDLLDLLQGSAADSIITAIVDPRGPLHSSFGDDIAAEDRAALLALLLKTATAEELLASLPERLLRELKLGVYAVPQSAGRGKGTADGELDGAGSDEDEDADGAGTEPAAERKPRVAPQLAALSKYLGKPPKYLKGKAKIKSERAASLVYEIWAAKAREDTFDDSRGETRQGLGAYTRDYLLQKLGLASLADGAFYGIVDAVRRFSSKNSRLKLFGKMLGVTDTEAFSPRISDMFLNLCKRCFPKFTDKTLKNRPVGTCFVPLDVVNAALGRVFPSAEHKVRPCTDRIALELDLKAMLAREVQDNAVAYNTVARMGGEEDSVAGSGGEGEAAVKPGRTIRGGPDFSGSTVVVDFDWLALRVLEVWGLQRERDKRSMRRLFVLHDADGNGVLSFDEFTAMLADCTPSTDRNRGTAEAAAEVATANAAAAAAAASSAALASGAVPPLIGATSSRRQRASRSNAELAAVTAAATSSFAVSRHRPGSSRSAGTDGSARDLLATRRAVKLFEEVLRISEESGVSEDPDSASPEDFAALCDEHGIMPPPRAREQTPASLLATPAGAAADFAAFSQMPSLASESDELLGAAVTGITLVNDYDEAASDAGSVDGRMPTSARSTGSRHMSRLLSGREDAADFDVTGLDEPLQSTSSSTSNHSTRFVVGTPAGSAGNSSRPGADFGPVPGSSVLSRLPSSRMVRVRSRLSVNTSDEPENGGEHA
jgi:hypothetical protein